jgi:DNA-binding HxlR family transcriptional regulator
MKAVKSKPVSVKELSCKEKLRAAGDSLYVIGGKWKLPVLIALGQGHKRFNDLQRTIAGISSKVLSSELKELEINGFIVRKVDVSVTPVLVEYELTDYSGSLKEVVYALISWGAEHRARIKQSRLRGES